MWCRSWNFPYFKICMSIRNLHRLVAKHAHFAVLNFWIFKGADKKKTHQLTCWCWHIFIMKKSSRVPRLVAFFFSTAASWTDSHKWAAVAVPPVTAGNAADVNQISPSAFTSFIFPTMNVFLSKHDAHPPAPIQWFWDALLEILAVRMRKALASQFSQQIIRINK